MMRRMSHPVYIGRGRFGFDEGNWGGCGFEKVIFLGLCDGKIGCSEWDTEVSAQYDSLDWRDS